jgi:hypothetical protein
VAQGIVVIAFTISFLATFDCHFVSVDTNLVSGILDEIGAINDTIPSNYTTRGFGFYFYEETDGECTSRGTGYTETIYELYHNFLGSDWNGSTAMAPWSTFRRKKFTCPHNHKNNIRLFFLNIHSSSLSAIH